MSGMRFYLLLGAGALVIAALSLLIPSTPSYDPWAWLVWGREIVHLNLHTTGGPTWKPLPVLFTTVFALFGKAAARPVAGGRARGRGDGGGDGVQARLAADARPRRRDRGAGRVAIAGCGLIAPLLAGVIAAGSLVNSGGFISDNALGYSEGLTTALVLIAVDRHLDGARQRGVRGRLLRRARPARVCGSSGVPTGCSCSGRIPGRASSSIGLFVLIPVLWFLPELWGSGHLFAASRARSTRARTAPRSPSARSAPCSRTSVADGAQPGQDRRASSRWSRPRSACGARARVVAADRRRSRRVRARAWLLGIGLFGCRVVARDRAADAGRVLGQQPLPGARLGADRDRRRDRAGAGASRSLAEAPPARRGCSARASSG